MTSSPRPTTTVSPHNVFYFEGYDWDLGAKTLRCHYRLDDQEIFIETVKFDFSFAQNIHEESLQAAFLGYFIMAGISYYKASLPETVDINPAYLKRLSPDQAKFFDKTYYHGLGELFYQNNLIPFRLEFPSSANYESEKLENYPPLNNTLIVPLGGGKDSLTSVQLLQDAGLSFQTWTVGDYPGLAPSLREIHGPEWNHHHHLKIKRTIDPRLIELNQAGAFNGHVPISSLWAFLSVITALLTSQRYIAFSNEASANQPSLEINGESINHQYSKTLEFEQDFRAYVQKFIHPEIEYFSLLRPFTELYIAEIFSQKAWSRFRDKFSSCNRNFTQSSQSELTWCGQCPKCAFVFLILAPFIPPAGLFKIFGKNLFSDPNLDHTWNELLGLTEHKPFECVGTIEEVKKALQLAADYYPEVNQWETNLSLPADYDYRALSPHCVPAEFQAVISAKLPHS